MKNPLLLSGAAVALVCAGFIAGRSSGARHDAETADGATATGSVAQPRQSSAGRRSESSADVLLQDLLKGRALSELSTEEAYELIQPHLKVNSKDDPLVNSRNSYLFHLLMTKLPLPVLEKLVTTGSEKGISEFRLNEIFGAYALRDWDRAMAWAETRPNASVLRSGAISRLALTDPVRAAEFYDKELLEGSRQPSLDTNHTISIAFAKQGRTEFFKFFDMQPSAMTSPLLYNAMRNLPQEEMPAFLEELNKRVEAGTLEQRHVNNLMREVARTHPEEREKWLAKLEPGKERADAQMMLVDLLAIQGKTAESDAMLKKALADMPGKEKEFIMDEVPDLLRSNPELASRMLELLPDGEKLTHQQVKNWENRIYSRPDGMITVAKLLPSQEEQAAYLVGSFSRRGQNLNAKDFQIISHRLQGLGLTGAPAEEVRAALEAARVKALGK